MAFLKRIKNSKNIFDEKNFFFSLKPTKGGIDSKDCVKIIYNQYINFFKKNNINYFNILTSIKKNLISKIVIKLKSKKKLKYLTKENGINKIIRNSPYKKNNSVQTSYCSIFFYPFLNDKKIDINKKQLSISFCKSSGAGGQSVNKTNSAVRIVHLPSGVSVKCQKERSQHLNKIEALKIIEYKVNKYYINIKKNKTLFSNNLSRIYYLNKSLVINKNPFKKTNKLLYILKGNIDYFYK
ncbi:peptide chain release factor-like protein [Candidatus Vidania fulgoroideorum]